MFNWYKRGIYSLNTALYLHDLTDRTPEYLEMTFPLGYNLTRPKEEGILCNNAKSEIYSLGIEEIYTPSGNIVKVYNAEKTLCDLLRKRNHADIRIVSDAFREYFRREGQNIPLLSEYAEKLHVKERLRYYLEVLL